MRCHLFKGEFFEKGAGRYLGLESGEVRDAGKGEKAE